MSKEIVYETTSPLVSIIMNCFNGESYLGDAIESVLDQTYKNWEIIFWDNQSDDNSAKIFNKYKDPRFKYFLAKKHNNTVLHLLVRGETDGWNSFVERLRIDSRQLH